MVPAPTTTHGSASPWANHKFTHIINGKNYDQPNAKMLDVINPATEKVVAQVPIADQKVVDDAVKSARDALPGWRKLSWQERKAKLAEWHKKSFQPMKKELVPLYTAEQGRTLALAEAEFGFVEAFWDLDSYYEPKDEVISDDGTNKNVLRMYPIGVSAALVPWNYPLNLTVMKVVPALLTGGTVIVKPSPFTPLMTLKYMIEAQKHLPPGVLNVVVGDDSLGPMLTEHPTIDHISFTGSTATGRLVARSCAATLKRVTLELGGNDACIILPGIDFDQVPLQVFVSALQNSGQFCSAAKRLYVHESIYDQFSQAFTAIMKQTKLGDGSDPSIGMGPVVNRTQFNKVNEFLLDIQKNGQKALTGGKVHEGKGYFVPLTVVDNPPDDSKVVTEEPFGPVVPLLKFSTEEEVIERANASLYGLGGQVWDGDLEQCQRIADQLETGTVWINQMQNFDPASYFGGWKQSGIGGCNGRQGIESYMQPKTIKIASKVAPFPPPASH